MAELTGKKIAVIVADGFEQIELDGPVKALREAGATIEVLAQDRDHLGSIKGMNHFEKGDGTKGDKLIAEARYEDYDGLLVPGGLASPDTMRQSQQHLDFVRRFVEGGKPTAVICHGPWLLADADVIRGREVTSWPGIRHDVERAGAKWSNREVVVDKNLVTSRKPDDIPAFAKAFIQALASNGARTSRTSTAERVSSPSVF